MTAVYLGDHTVLAETVQGRKIFLDSRDVSLTPHIALRSQWEPGVTNWVLSTLPGSPEGIFIDGGANVGWYSLLARHHKRDVLAIDANPRMVELLKKTFAVNGMLPPQGASRVECAALGHQDEAHCFLVHAPDNFGSADVAYRSDNPNKIVSKEATMRTLDSLLAPGTKVCMIKLDIEGWEPQALQGAERVLEENPQAPLLLEHNAGNGSCIESMCLRGYGLALIDGYSLQEIVPTDLVDVAHGRMLVLRRRK